MTDEFQGEPSMRTYLAILRGQRWLVIGAAMLGLTLGIGFSLTQQPLYTANAQVLVQGIGVSTTTGVVQQPITPTEVLTELELVTSAPVRRAVQRTLGSVPTVTVSEVGQTNVLAIAATSTDPAWSAQVANAYAQGFVAYQHAVGMSNLVTVERKLRSQISHISHQLGARPAKHNSQQTAALLGQQAVLQGQLEQVQISAAAVAQNVQVITPALAPSTPSSPGPKQDGTVGFGAGLLLGVAIAFLRNALNDTLRSKETAERLVGQPVLGLMPRVATWKKREQAVAVAVSEPTSPAAEAYRSLRTSIQFIRQERELRTIVVTSAAAHEGKSTIVANLSVVFAQAGERVVLVSCDLRRPRVGKFLGFGEERGFTSVLLGHAGLEEVVQPVEGHRNLWALPSGPIPPNPAELLSSSGAQSVIENLRAHFDIVLLDSPPVLLVTDAAVLSKVADGTLLVAAAGQTRQGDLRRAAEKLSQINAPVIGVVLNQLTKHTDRYAYGYAYGYGYGHGYKSYGYAPRQDEVAVIPHGAAT